MKLTYVVDSRAAREILNEFEKQGYSLDGSGGVMNVQQMGDVEHIITMTPINFTKVEKICLNEISSQILTGTKEIIIDLGRPNNYVCIIRPNK